MGEDQIQTLGRFMFPGRLKQFMNIYHEATKKPYSYLVTDAKQTTPEDERFKSDIFHENEACSKAIRVKQIPQVRHSIIDCRLEDI